MSYQTVAIPLENNTAILKFRDFDSDIDIDEVIKINYSNIVGEILTISVLVNQIGLLRASHEGKVKEFAFNLSIYKAKLGEKVRRTLGATQEKVTIQQIDNAVLMDEGVQLQTKTQFRLEKELAYLEALYTAVKSKDQKLNGFSRTLTPADMEQRLIESAVNNTFITIKRNSF